MLDEELDIEYFDMIPEGTETDVAPDAFAFRTPLLTESGNLSSICWAPYDAFIWNKEKVRPYSRRKETEIYRILGSGWMLTLSWVNLGWYGECRIELLDTATGESFTSGSHSLFCRDRFDLDHSPCEEHILKMDDKDFFLLIRVENGLCRIYVHSEDLEIDLSAHDIGEILAQTADFPQKRSFLYRCRRIFPDLSGWIKVHGRDYSLDETAFLYFEGVRSQLPASCTWVAGYGAQEKDGMLLGILLGQGPGERAVPAENALLVNETLFPLNAVEIVPQADSIVFRDVDGRIWLEFDADYSRAVSKTPLDFRHSSTERLGTVSGSVILDSGEKIPVEHMSFLYETGRAFW